MPVTHLCLLFLLLVKLVKSVYTERSGSSEPGVSVKHSTFSKPLDTVSTYWFKVTWQKRL